MNSIQNSVTLIGNLGQDPEVTTTQGGGKIAKFSLATTYTYKNKGGEKMQETDWHRCVVFGKSAEIIEQYCRKGHKLAIQGRIKYGSYTDKNSVERYTTDIIVNDFIFLTQKGDSLAVDGQTFPQPNNTSAPAPKPDGGADDDLPF